MIPGSSIHHTYPIGNPGSGRRWGIGEQKRKEFTWSVSRIHARQIAPGRGQCGDTAQFPDRGNGAARRPPRLAYIAARRAARTIGVEDEDEGDGRRAAASWADVRGGGNREAAGKKRKASAEALAAMRREPRRGLGVAELERIRVALEVAEGAATPRRRRRRRLTRWRCLPVPLPWRSCMARASRRYAIAMNSSPTYARSILKSSAMTETCMILMCRSEMAPFISCKCRGDISPRITSPCSSTNPLQGK
jgi:hypothetical protein